MKVYIAGPDVFRLDVEAWAASARALCAARGLTALLPIDGLESTAEGIYRANRTLLASADAMVANLNPWRGAEPDSGTCVEVGIALALDKPVVGYLDELTPMVERVAVRQSGGRYLDGAGQLVEDFGLALNLMLAVPVPLVVGGLAEALAALVAQTQDTVVVA